MVLVLSAPRRMDKSVSALKRSDKLDSVLRCTQPEWMDIDMTKRWNFSAQFKATVALKALCGDKTVQEISVKRHLHPTQVSTWKRQAMEGLASLFSDKANQAEIMGDEIKELHANIEQLAVETDFLSQGLKR